MGGFIRKSKQIPWIASPIDDSNLVVDTSSEDESDPHRSKLRLFKEHHECATPKLFYDLFFVANLATFSDNHKILDGDSEYQILLANMLLKFIALQNYIGFFVILWFTWLQTTMFDISFSTDSVIDRLGKVFSFSVLIGIAMCGVLYDANMILENHTAFRSLCLVLMVSRFSLSFQYGQVAFQARKYRQAQLVLLWTGAVLLLSAVLFLGISFFFSKTASKGELRACYAL